MLLMYLFTGDHFTRVNNIEVCVWTTIGGTLQGGVHGSRAVY